MIVAAEDAAIITKLPSACEAVAVFSPLIEIVAPAMGEPVCSSLIFPVTVVCPKHVVRNSKPQTLKIKFLIVGEFVLNNVLLFKFRFERS